MAPKKREIRPWQEADCDLDAITSVPQQSDIAGKRRRRLGCPNGCPVDHHECVLTLPLPKQRTKPDGRALDMPERDRTGRHWYSQQWGVPV